MSLWVDLPEAGTRESVEKLRRIAGETTAEAILGHDPEQAAELSVRGHFG